jgi:hypothetical protein
LRKELRTALADLLKSQNEEIRIEALRIALGAGTRNDEARKRASRRFYLKTQIRQLEVDGSNPARLQSYRDQLAETEKELRWKRTPANVPVSPDPIPTPGPTPEEKEAERQKMAEYKKFAEDYLASVNKENNDEQ